MHFREAGELDGLATDLLLHALKAAGGAQTAGALKRGIEQGKELKRKIIAGGELMIRRSRRPGAGQSGREPLLELPQQFPVVKLSFTKRRRDVGGGRNHAPSKPQCGGGVQ